MLRKLCRRYDEPGHAHSLTFGCYRRLPLLSRDRTRRWFLEAVAQARDQAGFDLWAYVIMPEHVHLLASPRSPSSRVSELLWRIKRPVARRAFGFLKVHSATWLERLTVTHEDGSRERRFRQVGGGYDRNVFEAATTWNMVEYYHLNPVRRGLVDHPTDWEWSSAQWYAGQNPVLMAMDGKPPPVDLTR